MYSNILHLATTLKQSYNLFIAMEENPWNIQQIEVTPEPAATQKKESEVLRFLIDVLETLVLSAVLFLAINAVSARIRVDGNSMEPTLQNGEFVIVNKLAYKLGSPKTGDVIVFHYPRDPNQEYIKRVIGLSGDHVNIMNGQVYVDDEILPEPYIATPPRYKADWNVPEDSLFVLGDNRNNSSDSHNWGPVPMEYVIGKALFIYWPPNAWGAIDYSTAVSAASP
jgi:signal peptidase I